MPFQPLGISLASSIFIPDEPGFRVAQLALNAVTRVHGDGKLRPIGFGFAAIKQGIAAYLYDLDTGRPLELRLNLKGGWNQLDVVHEVGHLLHHQVLASHHEYTKNIVPTEMKTWFQSVKESATFQRIQRLHQDDYTFIKRNGKSIPIADTRETSKYLLLTKELWARSYAQFVAISSGESAMLSQLAGLRDSSDTQQVAFPSQWQDDEFEPIAQEIENLFLNRGWIQ